MLPQLPMANFLLGAVFRGDKRFWLLPLLARLLRFFAACFFEP
jgi:hypothetical protein